MGFSGADRVTSTLLTGVLSMHGGFRERPAIRSVRTLGGGRVARSPLAQRCGDPHPGAIREVAITWSIVAAIPSTASLGVRLTTRPSLLSA
jgi:hypothetical protein